MGYVFVHGVGDAEHFAHPDVAAFFAGFVGDEEAVVDFVETFNVFPHEFGSIGAGEEVPILPLRVAKPFCCGGVCLVEVEGLGGGDLVGEGEEREADAAGAVVEVEALDCRGAPVVANRDHVVGYFLDVENLGYGLSLVAVVVVRGVYGFGGPCEAEQVDDDEGVGKIEKGGDRAGPHVGVVWVAMEEHEGRNIFLQFLVEIW